MNTNNTSNNPQGSPLTVVLTAIVALGLLSMLPWGEITGHKLKDFSLLSDIQHSAPVEYITEEIIDPALAAELAADSAATDATAEEEIAEAAEPSVIVQAEPHDPVPGAIEDYSGGTAGARLKAAASSGTMRCAMIGDSYIEGDIFSGSIRRPFHERFGGAGVGYVPMTSAVAGFRRTVRLSSDGFTARDIRNDRKDSLHTLPGEYFTAATGAKATFKGEKGGAHTASWQRSRLVFLAPNDGVISISTDGSTWNDISVSASSSPQCITHPATTSRFDVRCNVEGLVVFGAWLDSPTGASLDCMSLRGYSGISHRSMSIATARAMAAQGGPDYDLIVVEYGMNALSSQQTEYTAYGNLMKRVLLRIKACYPNACVVMLGVGDRGQKQGTEVGSLVTTAAIVDAQRKAAKEAGVMFWDMREAMGGEGSVVAWRDRGLINADYIHLNHKGGEEMGRLFVESLMKVIDE